MLKKVGVFLDDDSYGASPYMAKGLSNAFRRLGLEVVLYPKELQKAPLQMIRDKVDFTLSFMDSVMGERLLCDYIQVPHFTYLVDPSHCFFHHSKSEYSFLSSIDPVDAQFLKRGGFNRVIHLPLAVDRDDYAPFSKQRVYPLSFIGSCWDYNEIEKTWDQVFTKDLAHIMRAVASETLASSEVSHLSLFPSSLEKKGYDLTKVPYADMQVNIGLYIRGYERVKLLKSIKKVPIHVWGSFRPKKTWNEYLKGHSNIHIHPPVSYAESLLISSQTKILLNSSPQFKYGIHDRAFSAPLKGALLASIQTKALEDHFTNQALLCEPGEIESFEDRIQNFLEDDNLRESYVEKAVDTVLEKHTWDQRIGAILRSMDSFVKSLKEKKCKV